VSSILVVILSEPSEGWKVVQRKSLADFHKMPTTRMVSMQQPPASAARHSECFNQGIVTERFAETLMEELKLLAEDFLYVLMYR
jgi:hypothetical protein